jgi:hypothetical protein
MSVFRRIRPFAAWTLIIAGLATIYLFTAPIRFVIHDAIGDEVEMRYEQAPPDGWAAAKWKAFWVTGGWGWIAFIAVTALPGIGLSTVGLLLLLRHPKTQNG